MLRSRLHGVALIVAFVGLTAPVVQTTGPRAEVVFEWNQILQDTITAAGPAVPRYYAIMHVAIFDAVNAIEQEFDPYRVRLRRGAGGSPEAAAAQAAHDVLVALIPGSTATYDAALAARFGRRPSSFVRRGAAIGAQVAQNILAWRQDDGWTVPSPPYVNPPIPGLWQPAPPANAAATFTNLQSAAPMALLTPTQYLPAPPPPLTSALYAAGFNDVKLIGRSDSLVRTQLQTDTARLWANIGTPTTAFAVWNNIVRDVAREQAFSLVEVARLFALVNVSITDAVQTTQVSKFVYGLWRPVTAIRQAESDFNDATDPDPDWLSLIPTPPYPAYGGNQAAIGASAARALWLALGTNDVAVTARWRQAGDLPDVTHDFASFWEAAKEQANSRRWGGIHYGFDAVAGQKAGKKVAEFVFANYMRPRGHGDDSDWR